MTFTQKIKAEILHLKSDKKCCRKSMLYGMLLFSPWFEKGKIRFSSENKETAEKVCKLLTEVLGKGSVELFSTSTGEKTEYKFKFKNEDHSEKLLELFGYDDGTTYRIISDNFKCDLCRAAFLRGAFLSCASAVSPESGYHLEFVVSRFNLSRELLSLLKKCGFDGKYTKRNSHYIIYFKDSEAIVDIIALIGAVKCSFDMTNLIIEKEIRNNCNRVANCETANLQRTILSANRHCEAIQWLFDNGKIGVLTEELRETAELRIENPELSLIELSEIHSPPVSKSCVNHRLKKIYEIYEKEINNQ